MMATSYALCLGVNAVDEYHYGSTKGLATADDSALKLHQLFFEVGMNTKCLIYKEASYLNVKKHLFILAENMVSGDTLYVSFSGHGARVTEEGKLSKQAKKYEDRGWCLYDRVVFYFELWEWARRFASGVRIVVLSDCCFSGLTGFAGMSLERLGDDAKTWMDHAELYNPIILESHRPMDFQVAPAVLVLSASARDSKAFEEGPYTVFMTSIIGSMMNNNSFNYLELYAQTVRDVTKMREEQTPRWHYVQGHQKNDLPHSNIFEIEKMEKSKELSAEQVQEYDIVAHSFYGVENQLQIEVANPHGTLNFVSLSRQTNDIPTNVDQTPNGTEPWVDPAHHHLILKFDRSGGGPNPIIVQNTLYYNDPTKKDVDVISVDITTGGSKGTGKKVKRAVAIVRKGAG